MIFFEDIYSLVSSETKEIDGVEDFFYQFSLRGDSSVHTCRSRKVINAVFFIKTACNETEKECKSRKRARREDGLFLTCNFACKQVFAKIAIAKTYLLKSSRREQHKLQMLYKLRFEGIILGVQPFHQNCH